MFINIVLIILGWTIISLLTAVIYSLFRSDFLIILVKKIIKKIIRKDK